MISQPPNMARSLLPHQLTAVYEMEKRESCQEITVRNFSIYSNIGIYADIVGYGKTLAVVALILRDRMSFDSDAPFLNEVITQIYGQGSIVKKQISQYQKINSTLIVVSQSIIKQWIQEFEYTNLQVAVINNKKKCEVIDPHAYDAILCSPTMYNHLVSRFPNCAWKRFVFDEPTHIKISGMRKIVAGFHWLITATPDMLLYTNNYRNSYHYLGALFGGYFDYQVFKQLIFKNDDDYVRASFQLPIAHHLYHQCYHTITSLLKNIISDHVSEMISAGNIEGAIKSLGGTSSNNIIELIKTEKMDYLKEADLKIQRYRRLQDTTRMLKWEKRKTELTNELQQLESRIRNVFASKQCHICLESQNARSVMLKCCYNMYCAACILKWFEGNDTCPLCREEINPSFLIYVQDCTDVLSNQIDDTHVPIEESRACVYKSKMDVIKDLFSEKQDGKFIIFSDYDETLKLLQQHLDVNVLEIKGKMETRNKTLELFKTSDTRQILFLNSLDNGAGLNLQEATDIILFHSMSDSKQTQIVGRCHRIGRTSELMIHHLVN
jgi:SNF2 family DNA or RNA helicase